MKPLCFVQCILIGAAVLFRHTDGVYSNITTVAGREMIFALPSVIFQPPEITLVINTPYDSANYSVETSTGTIATGTITNIGHFITLNNNLQVTSSGYSDRNKGIRVIATGKNPLIVLVAMRFSIYLPLGFGEFKVHQNIETINEPASYEYFALSTDYNGQSLNRRSEVLLVGNHNDTVISITPTQTVSLPEDAQSHTADLVSIAPGTTHNVTLNQFQTLLVFNPTYDITGTRIVSTKPLTVLTGHQCAQFPTSATFCEPVHVQMPPTFLWGNEFLLAPFAGRTSQQQYKLVTAENSTTIVYRCGTSTAIGRTLSGAGVGDYLSFPAGLFCSLVATKPIFVVQLGAGHSIDNVGDPVMAVVSPTDRHVNCITFLADIVLFPFSFISITVLPEHFGNDKHIVLDGNELSCSWNEIYNSSGLAGYGCSISITTTGKHFVNHSDGLLSVTAYGWSNSPAWGHAILMGMSLEKFETTDTISELEISESESLPFVNLSIFANLRELPRELEASSPPIYLPGYLVYGNQVVRSVYMNENGVFSFNKPYKFSHPNQFPTGNIFSRLSNVVAPFWSDNDIRKNGTVRYIDIKKGSSDDFLLSYVESYLKQTDVIKETDTFDPTWMIVAQWDKVHPYPHGADSQDELSGYEEFLSKTNTYQGIIITNRVSTYYIFTYTCGELQWSGGHGLEHAVVGNNSHGHYFYNTPGSGYENIADIVSCSFQIKNQRKKRQASVVQTNSMQGSMTASSLMIEQLKLCFQLINGDNNSLPMHAIHKVLENLPDCPPTITQCVADFLFETDFTKTGCFRSKIQINPDDLQGLSPFRSYLFVQQCCYFNGGLITSGDGAGSLLQIHNDSSDFESKMYNSCCLQSENCDEYRKRRPISMGTNYEAPCAGRGFGDPHYHTFDFDGSMDLLFTGEGYYVILEVVGQDSNFTLQSNLDGLFMTSLAFGIAGIESYQFARDNQFQVYNTTNRNKPQNVTFDNNGIYKGDLFQLKMISSKSMEAIYFAKRIVIKMGLVYTKSRNYEVVNFDIQIPKYLCQNSSTSISGHLGNCDGNADNDMLLNPNDGKLDGSSISLFGAFSTSRKRRQVSDQLQNCSSVATCENSSYVPPKFEDLTFTDAQRQFCDNIKSCLYDLVVTGDKGLAGITRNIDQNGTRTTAILRNEVPKFNGPEIFNVTVGTENIYIFSVQDNDNNFTVTIEGEVPDIGQLVDNGEGMYTFRWMLSSIPTSNVTFRAEDSLSAIVFLSPQLHVCSCFNGGTCTLDGVVSSDSLIIIMTCLCTEAYGGDSCTEDRNGCSEIECFEGVECFDVPAPGVGVVCGSCPPGYTGDGLKCIDNNECSGSPGLCDQVCKNTVGSYECGCHTGFMLINGSSQCQDINECNGVNNICQQQCNNTVGSYECSCQLGFSLNSDGVTCTPQQTCASGNSCSHICAVVGEMEKCFCPVGLELANGNTTKCVDINECDRFSPCEQVCDNSMGSYMCLCESGYELMNDMQTCEDVDECKAAALNGTQICFNKTQCLNTPGSYNCTCVPGYTIVNGKCERRDIQMTPEVQYIIPLVGQNNSHMFTVQTYTNSELTSMRIQAFRVATAKAITRFCAMSECSLVNTTGETRSMNVLIEPQDIAILTRSIIVDSAGRPVLTFFVQLNEDTFVSVATVSLALEVSSDIYRNAGFLLQDNSNNTDPCGEHTPCQNGATCTTIDSINVYSCTCATGYTGRNCSVDIDDCVSNPCQNGGTCTDGIGRFTCTCPPSVMGDLCEQGNNNTVTINLPLIIGIVVGVLLLFLVFTLLVTTVYCIWRRVVVRSKKSYDNEIHAAFEIPPEKVEIPMQERKHTEKNLYAPAPFKNSEVQ